MPTITQSLNPKAAVDELSVIKKLKNIQLQVHVLLKERTGSSKKIWSMWLI